MRVAPALLMAVVFAACTGSATTSSAPPSSLEPALASARPVTVPDAVSSFTSTREYRTPAEPVAIAIPAIAVKTDLQELRRAADGTIEVPEWNRAGWWAEGPKPGQRGPAVILGHVDSTSGPDVFFRLDELRPGDGVTVITADGNEVHFVIQRLERHPKDSFPSEAVYAPSLQPGLRLVTCGGSYDRSTGHYRDNVVAFAELR